MKRSIVRTILGDNRKAASRQNDLAISAMPKGLIWTLASTVLSSLTYYTANNNFIRTLSVGRDEEVDETEKITTKIRDALPVRFSLFTEGQLATAR